MNKKNILLLSACLAISSACSRVTIERRGKMNPINQAPPPSGQDAKQKTKSDMQSELEKKLGVVEKTPLTTLLKESHLKSIESKNIMSRLTKAEYRFVIEDLFEGLDDAKIANLYEVIAEFPETNYDGLYNNQSNLALTTNLDSQKIKLSWAMAKATLEHNTWQQICPTSGKCFEAAISEFLPQIWRKYVSTSEKDELKKFYDAAPANSRDEMFLARIYLSPNFHYKQYFKSDKWEDKAFQVGSSIAFMISGSIPDKELLVDMKNKDILHPNVIRKHAKRLLAKHHERFSKLFVSQWLGYSSILENSANTLYKEVPLKTISHELDLIFSNLIAEDEPISSFFTLKYNMANKELAKVYGKKIDQDEWIKAKYTETLFGTAFFSYKFTDHKTDYPNPILRGSYLVNNLLCIPVQFPSAEQLAEVDKVLKEVDPKLSPPDRMAYFRTKPACKGCHDQFDHQGLALEEIGAMGVKRDKYYTGDSIKAHGNLNGIEFVSSIDYIEKMSDSQDLRTCFTGQLYNYFSGIAFHNVKRDIMKQPDLSVFDDLNVNQTIEDLIVYAFGGEFL